LKKALSILMLIIFLFNVGGYYLAFWALEFKTEQALSVRIDLNQYTSDETITIKIPVALPYPIQERDYERVDGTFEYNGEYFKMVKHKLQGDTLFVVCIKNQDQKEMVDTITDYVKLANDLPGNAKKALSFFGKLLKDFDHGYSTTYAISVEQAEEIAFARYADSLESVSRDLLSPPPKA
jgi:hypothetical protein